MEMLTKLEELVLIAVLKLGPDAYGMRVYDYVTSKTGKKVAVSGVYFPLERLVRRGYLRSFKGEPTPKRGGMRKRHYVLTEEGVAVLQENRRLSRTIWKDMDDIRMSGAEG